MGSIKFILGILLISALIIGGAYSLKNFSKSQSKSLSNKNKTNENISPSPSASVPTVEQFKEKQVITLTKTGFDPANITVGIGTLIQWINKSGEDASLNSAEHPTHQVYPPLNLGLFPNGSSVSLVFDKAGTYKYHDHLHPERVGTVTIK